MGKSTLVASIAAELGPTFRGVTHFHFLNESVPGRTTLSVTDPHGQMPRSWPAVLAKAVYYLARSWLNRRWRISRAVRRGELVILERDLIDVSVDPVRYRMRDADGMLNLFARLSPKPDLMIVLEADPSEIMSRSDELDELALMRLRDRYREAARRSPAALIIDASLPAAQVAALAVGAIRRNL